VEIGQHPGVARVGDATIFDLGAKRTLQQIVDAIDERVQSKRRERELLRPGECQQLLGQFDRAFGRIGCERGVPLDARISAVAPDQLEISRHDGQQIVEVMRDPAGQLPHRLHLLRLHQRGLRALALGDFAHQLVIGPRKLGCPIDDAAFQRRVELGQPVLGGPQFLQLRTGVILTAPDAKRGRHRAGEGLRVNGPFENHDVSERLQ
jgi:hypothetical protein